ncbi:MAG TPA: 50S ribosomal protein L11 methyltransferase [Casimicrobiaceae bacterium]|nr:50S ribosomal protein L11 methyltransferase [Casimicrobiaceae bacterium]
MSYMALRVDVEAEDADAWSDALLASGAFAVDACDPRAGTSAETPIYAEPGCRRDALWPITQLTALFEAGNDVNRALQRAAASVLRSPPPHEAFAVPERDWVQATQMQFEPIRIAEGFWIVPSWCTPPDPSSLNLSLDPGLAFGTGSHPTTKLCLMWLREHIRNGASVLDYGCGSGILSIAARRLGARRVVGTDTDPQAILASVENTRLNAVEGSFILPDALGDETFDIVVANILTSVLLTLASKLASRLHAGGRIALSGILAPQADAVIDAYRYWFDISTWQTVDGWSLLEGVRRSSHRG